MMCRSWHCPIVVSRRSHVWKIPILCLFQILEPSVYTDAKGRRQPEYHIHFLGWKTRFKNWCTSCDYLWSDVCSSTDCQPWDKLTSCVVSVGTESFPKRSCWNGTKKPKKCRLNWPKLRDMCELQLLCDKIFKERLTVLFGWFEFFFFNIFIGLFICSAKTTRCGTGK